MEDQLLYNDAFHSLHYACKVVISQSLKILVPKLRIDFFHFPSPIFHIYALLSVWRANSAHDWKEASEQ